MRRAVALAVTAAFAFTGVASAETWTKFATMENGAEVSYDKDYVYKDRQSGRFVVMLAGRRSVVTMRFRCVLRAMVCARRT